ncbi:hypothetical protein NG798_27470 [Ancylothrix sp. C2]|uniref:hypothetical protein n=1 Tax=Ancylothrix sp. D3o TaxID=2953691 RepID=UPI0021BB4A3A|nr:hypothetical protein [Ancylothrix sp. D3o]MCT7953541.1 hypothetical protein [Ancylothrix sp. D3o]
MKPSSLSEPISSHGSQTTLSIQQLEELGYFLEELEPSIEEVTARLEKLEKRSKLEKKLRKYKRFEPSETWASRWVASPIAYLFPEERREEWLGDLYEVNREMIHKGYPFWAINTINVGKTAVLVLSSLKIKLSDFISVNKVGSK